MGFTHILALTARVSMFCRTTMCAFLFAFPGPLPVALAALLDSLDRLDGIGGLFLFRNPWEYPPDAVVTGGTRAVRQYFEAFFEEGGATVVTRPLKDVIVGQETVGKTRCEGSTLVSTFCSYGLLHSFHISDLYVARAP